MVSIVTDAPQQRTITEGYVHPACQGQLTTDFTWGSVCPQCGARVTVAIETRVIRVSDALMALNAREDTYDVMLNARYGREEVVR